MIGPFPPPYHGQSIANETLKKGLKSKEIEVISLNTRSGKKVSSEYRKLEYLFVNIIYNLYYLMKNIFIVLFKKYDVIYMTPGQSYFGFLKFSPYITIAKNKGKPIYIHIHGGGFREYFSSFNERRKNKIKKVLNSVDGIIVLGESLKSMFDNIVERKDMLLVCENGVKEEFFLSEKIFKEKLTNFSEEIRILYMSLLEKSKGILDLLKACELMRKEGIDFHLDLAGNISKDIETEINYYLSILDKNVTYHGFVNGIKKKELLIKNYIFCLPTYYINEGQPISVLEAYANGMAVVVTNQGGIQDIFKEGKNGFFCEKNNPHYLKNRIIETHRNYKNFAVYNYYISKEKYTEEEFVNRIINILKI